MNFAATVIPSNKEMAKALQDCGAILLTANILTSEGLAAMSEAAERLHSKSEDEWDYSIPLTAPVSFAPRTDRQNRTFTPKIGVDRISVIRPETEEFIPFKQWDIALTLEFSEPEIHCPRWHFDMANVGQPGPITHLQYGGYRHENNDHLDTSVQEPRWFIAPMDVILLSEVVAANFYHETWISALREEPRWQTLVHTSQKLCYPHYLAQLQRSIGVTGANAVLCASWNDKWADLRP